MVFFIKSENAKKFRDWAEDYIVTTQQQTPKPTTPYINQLERENIELRRAMNRLLAKPTYSDEFIKLQNENKHIKRTLIELQDRYHNIVMKSQDIEVVKKRDMANHKPLSNNSKY